MNIANDNTKFSNEVTIIMSALTNLTNALTMLCQDNEHARELSAYFHVSGGGDILTELAKVSLDTRTHCLLQAVELGVL